MSAAYWLRAETVKPAILKHHYSQLRALVVTHWLQDVAPGPAVELIAGSALGPEAFVRGWRRCQPPSSNRASGAHSALANRGFSPATKNSRSIDLRCDLTGGVG
jgi:hypothetical protein